MIDKQKLLQWAEDKKYVFEITDGCLPYEDDYKYCQGALKVLSLLDRAIELGEFGVEEVAHERSEASSASAART